jgi:nucleoside-diphosphate-sugar epimerase
MVCVHQMFPIVKTIACVYCLHSCVTSQEINAKTDGMEVRQFLHAKDTVNAMGKMMLHYKDIPEVTDLSSGIWSNLYQIADMVSQTYGDVFQDTTTSTSTSKSTFKSTCRISFSNVRGAVQTRVAPDQNTFIWSHWKPIISLHEGIQDLLIAYKQQAEAPKSI